VAPFVPEGIACRISDDGKILWEPLPPYEKPPTEAARRRKQEQSRLRTWLEATLGTEVIRAATIYDAGKEQGFSRNKLIAARVELGGRSYKVGFSGEGGWLWTLKPESELTTEEVQIASLGLPPDFPLESLDELETPLPGAAEAGQDTPAGSVADAAQESEDFGILNENGREMDDFQPSSKGGNRLSHIPDLTTGQLRAIAMRIYGLKGEPRPGSPLAAGRFAGNGHAKNGHARNGHGRNGK
jgi:hypothetical protein